MELYLKNIGKIAEASVKIEGISVIAGENDTGKSTVGRVLFYIIESLYDVEKQIHNQRHWGITDALEMMRENLYDRYYGDRYNDDKENIKECAERILSKSDAYKAHPEVLENDICSIFGLEYEIERQKLSSKLDDVTKKILDIINIPNHDIVGPFINRNIDKEFGGQLLNFAANGATGQISLKIRDESLIMQVTENGLSVDEIGYALHMDVVYIDDPFVWDDMNRSPVEFSETVMHREHLMHKLIPKRDNISVVEEIILENKLKNIYEKISSVCNGYIVRRNYAQYAYQPKNTDKALEIKNLSTGIKTFAILKTLLTNGGMTEKGTVILDEPEIHLHPEWQLLFAELIVLLHKEFGMHILLNTHSPYFVRAIQVYSAKYGISDVCRYYLSDVKEDGNAYIDDVTDNIDRIYAKLSRPLQQLEDERWNID